MVDYNYFSDFEISLGLPAWLGSYIVLISAVLITLYGGVKIIKDYQNKDGLLSIATVFAVFLLVFSVYANIEQRNIQRENDQIATIISGPLYVEQEVSFTSLTADQLEQERLLFEVSYTRDETVCEMTVQRNFNKLENNVSLEFPVGETPTEVCSIAVLDHAAAHEN